MRQCPECGRDDQVQVTFTGTCLLTQDGSEDIGDHEYDDESEATCAACNFSGALADFIDLEDPDR